MVEFKSDRMVITIVTTTNPIEDWLELMKELLYLTASVNPEHCNAPPQHTLTLLDEMLPAWETALKMLPFEKE